MNLTTAWVTSPYKIFSICYRCLGECNTHYIIGPPLTPSTDTEFQRWQLAFRLLTLGSDSRGTSMTVRSACLTVVILMSDSLRTKWYVGIEVR